MEDPGTKTWLKDHELAELVNEITKTAREFHDHQSLRSRLRSVVLKKLTRSNEDVSCSKQGET